jgi:hypothetical protein
VTQRKRRRVVGVLVLSAISALAFVRVEGERAASAGGPLFVGSPTMGTDGQPSRWDTSAPVAYRVDGGNLGALSNAAAMARVQNMFGAWESVPTASISYANAGPILSAGTFSDGDVSTASEFAEVAGDCDAGNQTPIVFDVDGTIFAQLGLPAGVIGFAGACDSISGNLILSAMAVMNGAFIDGNPSNLELTNFEFDHAFTHEFGHLSGLDHSQINVEVLDGNPNACSADYLAGLPLMFPFLFCQARQPSLPILAPDDIAWISELYPEPSYMTSYGFIEGTVYFSDGITHAQGVNVIARALDNPSTTTVNESRRTAFSVVSGYLFTGLPGQSVTGNNPGSPLGSRNPTLIGTYRIPVTPGTYRVEVESINSAFGGGSSVGPLNVPIPSPGPKEFWDSGESATDSLTAATNITLGAGQTVSNINIILNGTPPRFDPFESAQLLPPASPANLNPFFHRHARPGFALLRRDSLLPREASAS